MPWLQTHARGRISRAGGFLIPMPLSSYLDCPRVVRDRIFTAIVFGRRSHRDPRTAKHNHKAFSGDSIPAMPSYEHEAGAED